MGAGGACLCRCLLPGAKASDDVVEAAASSQSSTPRSTRAAPPQAWKEKLLARTPDLGQEPLGGYVFVHGCGDCDQLGLGDAVRECRKPTLIRGLSGLLIRSVACGGLHTLCITNDGRLFCWGCGDDGALGRAADADNCEPRALELAEPAKAISCGDCHSCALGASGNVWLWGSYKDSSGYIGIVRPGGSVVQKSSEPATVPGLPLVEPGSGGICSGSNHTIAHTGGRILTWGSNQTGQLGLCDGRGCEFSEEVVEDTWNTELVEAHNGGVFAVLPNRGASRVVRIRTADGAEIDARTMDVSCARGLLANGTLALIVEITGRECAMEEKQALLWPQAISAAEAEAGSLRSAFASAECSFITSAGGAVHGCGLNGCGQVGVGYASAGVLALSRVHGLRSASWLGGGTHMSAALVGDRVLMWGRAEECGCGAAHGSSPFLKPQAVALPSIRSLRCGMSHTLACSAAGDVFAWGCGITHQLGNRPRDVEDPKDANREPDDESAPYLLSSRSLAHRFVLLAAGGAQHSVEVTWCGDSEVQEGEADEEHMAEDEGDAKDDLCGALGSDGDAAMGSGQAIRVETTEDFWRVQVESIYRRRNPIKLERVPALMEKYKGQEAILYVKVCKTYDLNPSKFYADPHAWDDEEGDVKEDRPDDDGAVNGSASAVAPSAGDPAAGGAVGGPGSTCPAGGIFGDGAGQSALGLFEFKGVDGTGSAEESDTDDDDDSSSGQRTAARAKPKQKGKRTIKGPSFKKKHG